MHRAQELGEAFRANIKNQSLHLALSAKVFLMEYVGRMDPFLKGSPNAITLLTHDGRIISEFANMDRPREPRPLRVGTSLFDSLHPEDLQEVRNIFDRPMDQRHRRVDKIQFRIRSQIDNSWRYLDGSLRYDRLLDVMIMNTNDMTDYVRKMEQLEYKATHDGLTGLHNRMFFDEELQRLERSLDYPISIIVVDVNDLKPVNDGQGHDAGDRLLRGAAEVFQKALRKDDIVARIGLENADEAEILAAKHTAVIGRTGGDEFAILLPNTGEDAEEVIKQRIASELQKYNAIHTDLPLSISVGFATAKKEQSLHEIFKLADERMYQDKAEYKARTGSTTR